MTASAASPAAAARLPGIDRLRGLVVMLMALDHARDYLSAYPYAPTDLTQASAWLFLTRWITHVCAPVLMLLAGTSAALQGDRPGMERAAQQRFLVTRGLWLVLLELSWNSVMWRFDFGGIQLQVLWAIGWSMVALAAALWLPRPAILALGLVLVAGHNLLDGVHASSFGAPGTLPALAWNILHEPWHGRFANGFELGVMYPLLPWIGVLLLGYALGEVMQLAPDRRRRWLRAVGLGALLLFALLRLANGYGDPEPWSVNARGAGYTALGLLNVEKYPPSLDYLLMTLGPALCLLPQLDGWQGRLARIAETFGRVPMFFYLLHVPLIHGISLLARWLLFGAAAANIHRTADVPASYTPSLLPVYLGWLGVLALLYPLCRAYGRYKQRHRGQWWLSYL